MLAENPLERATAHVVPLGETMEGISGKVALDQVVGLDRIPRWTGHVYNLQTEYGHYSANGIIVANCHCWIDIDVNELRELAGTHKKEGTEPEFWDGSAEG